MKVCTDACIFGAYIANYLQPLPINNCLDIGTGTGLLSLMIAQKNNLHIDAVEIDNDAYLQAIENFVASPWGGKFTIYKSNILTLSNNKKYDCVICNPPFYQNDLTSINEKKTIAKHSISLTLQQLLHTTKHTITNTGILAVLLPYHRLKYFEDIANQYELFVNNILLVRHTAKHNFFRGILILSTNKNTLEQNELIIKNTNNQYSPHFIHLLKDYYLYL